MKLWLILIKWEDGLHDLYYYKDAGIIPIDKIALAHSIRANVDQRSGTGKTFDMEMFDLHPLEISWGLHPVYQQLD